MSSTCDWSDDAAAEDAAMREALTARHGVVPPFFLKLLAEALPASRLATALGDDGAPLVTPGIWHYRTILARPAGRTRDS